MNTKEKIIVTASLAMAFLSLALIAVILIGYNLYPADTPAPGEKKPDSDKVEKMLDDLIETDPVKATTVPPAYSTTLAPGIQSTTVTSMQTSTTAVAPTSTSTPAQATSTTLAQKGCDQMTGYDKMVCEAVERKDIRLCPSEEFTNFDAFMENTDSCRMNVFDKVDEIKTCTLMSSDPVWGPVCCYYLAISETDPSICSGCLSDVKDINLCMKNFQKYRADALENDIGVCKKFKTYSDACIRKNAVSSMDFNICNEYPEGSSKVSGCVHEVCQKIIDSGQISDCCKKVPLNGDQGQWHRNKCYISLAEQTQKQTYCKYMVSLDKTVGFGFYDECYEAVGIKSKDVEVCAKIEQDWIRDNCILEVGDGVRFCDRLTSEDKRTKCEKGLS